MRVHVFKGVPVSSVSIFDYLVLAYLVNCILLSRAAVEFLYNEGHIYSTIDDEHFKSTDA